MNGLNLAKNIGYELCEGGIATEKNFCECSLINVEKVLKENFKIPALTKNWGAIK